MSTCTDPSCAAPHRKPICNEGVRAILAHNHIGFNEDACNKLEALYDHATDRVASCIEDVVKLITLEIGPVLSGEAPIPHSDETAEDAVFMATERKLKLSGAVEALQKVIAAKDWDTLQVTLSELCAFVKDPTTAFLIDYDDVKHPSCETSCCIIDH